jgi:hypothetical protein
VHKLPPVIIGKDFAWAHLGKAGGEMTHALFNIFPELIEYADEPHTLEQHTPFQERAEQVGDRVRVLNIRRLPSWMLSFHIWQSQEGLAPKYETAPMLSPHQIANSDRADFFLSKYRPAEDPRIDVWLRTEHLVEDFLAFVRERTEVTEAHLATIRDLPRVNELVYDKRIDHWFTSAHIRLMYVRNPLWATVEAAVYGNTLG